uniref:Odorant-binding protein OBP43 n=1 Tax=Lobesia botrana TaxID=209534 RepID=A0A345BER6_9NEOP|nr:odorant-binding protein OBP43 [Lobesia botrana]
MIWNVIFAVVFCSCYTYAGMTDEEVKIQFTKIVMKCQKDHPVEMNELLALQSLQVPKNKDAKCLLACAYRAEGSMDAKGMYDLEHAYKLAETTQKGDDKRMANAKKLADICSKINEEAVSDGEKGCERATLLFKCIIDNAPKLGFKV